MARFGVFDGTNTGPSQQFEAEYIEAKSNIVWFIGKPLAATGHAELVGIAILRENQFVRKL